MKKAFITILILFILGCKNSLYNNKSEIAAVVGNELITLKEVDSIAEPQITYLKNSILQSIINTKLVKKYTVESGLNIDSLYLLAFSKKKKPFTDKYDSIHLKKIFYDSLISKLKQKYNVGVFIPENDNIKKLENLKCPSIGDEDSDVEIIFVFDYECGSCQFSKFKIDSLIRENRDKLRIKYVYFSEYVSPIAIACDAAGKQGKFWQMFDTIFNIKDNLIEESQLLNIAKGINLELEEFKHDINNSDKSIQKHSTNRQSLYDVGVYSVPTFIINGRIIENYQTLEVYLFKTLN